MPVEFENDNDFQLFLRDVGGYMVQLADGTGSIHRTFENLVEGEEYIVLYKERRNAEERYNRFIDSALRGFKDSAIKGVIRELESKGHTGVSNAHSGQKVRQAGSKDTLTDFDGIVQTDSHIFVVEAKMDAKVPAICV